MVSSLSIVSCYSMDNCKIVLQSRLRYIYPHLRVNIYSNVNRISSHECIRFFITAMAPLQAKEQFPMANGFLVYIAVGWCVGDLDWEVEGYGPTIIHWW